VIDYCAPEPPPADRLTMIILAGARF